MTIEPCKTCRYWRRDSALSSRGQCWWLPPTVFSSGQTMRPLMGEADGCGQHAAEPVPVAEPPFAEVAADAKATVEAAVVHGTAKRGEYAGPKRIENKRKVVGY